MAKAPIDQDTLGAYYKDFNQYVESDKSITGNLTLNNLFWAYVEGREHGKEIYPAPVPIKAKWPGCRHFYMNVNNVCMICGWREKTDYTHPLEIKNE